MKPRILPLLEMCIENGISLGWNRAHKHTENPTDEKIKDEIFNAVIGQIYEWFDFGDTE